MPLGGMDCSLFIGALYDVPENRMWSFRGPILLSFIYEILESVILPDCAAGRSLENMYCDIVTAHLLQRGIWVRIRYDSVTKRA